MAPPLPSLPAQDAASVSPSPSYDIAFSDIVEDEAVAEATKLLEAEGARVRFFRNDVAAVASHAGLIAEVKTAFGRLVLFVSNTGIIAPVSGG